MKLKKLFINKRIIFFIVISIIIFSVLTSSKLIISNYSTGKSAQIALAKQYITIAEDIANDLDKDLYQTWLTNKEYDENRQDIRRFLEQYRDPINALYVYILMLDESDISKVMVAALPPGVDDLPIGLICTVPPVQVSQAKAGQSYFTEIVKDEHNGTYLSIGVPFYNGDGKMIGVVGIDIDANDLELVSQQVVQSNGNVLGIDILFAVTLLIVVFILNKWYKFRLKLDLQESEKIYISELSKVIDTIKSTRHDLMNHLQVLNGLMDLKLYDKTSDYLKRLTIESKTLNLSLRIKNPILLVLFQSKWELAQSKNIQMNFETDLNDFSGVESMDLVKIFANLIDNSIEAVETYKGEQPKFIRVICKSDGTKYLFAVENTAELSSNEEKSLFQYGFTTQNNTDGLRGNGLTIIKRTVEKYQGDIYFQYEQGKLLIQITI
ncbi:histidine kinase [Paenibacillus sp. FSL H8-0548]|uniref:GHKL domain-containing protein n=1 Tax=Paenibacillus sp. FSL H8-0548 TaxID=1920422 RepID=UPI0009701D7D|nr:GHKL domain-containing protein [Paenibacillus sp. FSL H8-0548]OMF19724.1 histidine kinase [Paenibacillus sp. FSL H8-0548]